mgnify:CR=1 FL=1
MTLGRCAGLDLDGRVLDGEVVSQQTSGDAEDPLDVIGVRPDEVGSNYCC